MSTTNLHCCALAEIVELKDVDSEPDLAAIDLHLASCAACRAAYPEIAYLRNFRLEEGETSVEAVRSRHPARSLVAAAVLVLATLALDRFGDLGDPSRVALVPERVFNAHAGRIRILPQSVSTVTTSVASSTGVRNSTTRRTLALVARNH